MSIESTHRTSPDRAGAREERAHPRGRRQCERCGASPRCPQCGALLIAVSARRRGATGARCGLGSARGTRCCSWNRATANRSPGSTPTTEPNAVNLTHYLALRQGDKRSLVSRLGLRGLSSLGRCEPHVLVRGIRKRSLVWKDRFCWGLRAAVAQLQGRTWSTGPQHRCALRSAPTRKGATGHGDTPQ